MANKKLKQIQVKETTYDIDVATSLKVTNLSAGDINENNVVTAGAVKSYAAEKGHTHPDQESVSGNAGSADKLNTDAGSATQPVYFKDGVPVATTYALNKSVPADAKFTDEDTKNTAGATDTSSKIFLIGATAQTENPQTYSHDTAYVGTDGCLYSNSKKVSVEGHGTHVTYATANPGMDGTAAVGTSTKVAREDHIHPVDTSRAAKSTVDDHIANTDVHFTSPERGKLSGIEPGAQVNTITGVKGDNETKYRTGNVNITKANIGLSNVDNTADAEKSVSHADTAGSATKATQDANGNPITTTYATKNELNAHNGATDAHADIRNTITSLSNQVQGLLDVDDSTLAKMEELLENLENSEDLIANKVDKSDIVNNTTTDDATKVLSASQGVALYAYIDGTTANLAGHTGDTTSHITAAERTKWNAAKTHADAAHAPSNAEANVQSDWTETDTTSDAYIKNKPTSMTPTSHSHGNLANGGTLGTANAVVVTDGNKKLTASTSITTTELGYLNNARSNIQTQLDTVVHKYSQGLDFDFEFIEDEEIAMVIGRGACTDTDIIIPEYYDGKPVRVIEYTAFINDDQLRNITFPKNLQVIRYEAFEQCLNLESIIIPDNVIQIEEYAFVNCEGLKKVVIGNGVTSIDQHVFSGCTSLKSVTIPNSVTNIGDSAFQGCTSLESVVIPDFVTRIGEFAFADCNNLDAVVLGNNVHLVKGSAFAGCGGLKKVTMGSQITSIDESAFSGCAKLTDIIIPQGVKYIFGATFYGCAQLACITIPDSIEVIEEFAFTNCTALTDVYYLGSEDDWNKIEIYSKDTNNICLTNANIHYNHAPNFIDINTKVDDLDSRVVQKFSVGLAYSDLEDSDQCMVDGRGTCTDADIVIPKYSPDGKLVVAIGENFAGDLDLTSIVIPGGVTKITSSAFSQCANLKTVILPDTLTQLDGYVFEGCINLVNITLPDSLTYIGEGVFYDCGLVSITIPHSVDMIVSEAFCNCHKLQNVVIGDNATTVGINAFTYCSNLKSVTIGNHVDIIEVGAFEECISLESIVIPDSVTSIGGSAFKGCSSLKNVILGNSLSTIDGRAFEGCAISSLVIPASVTSIKQGAFNEGLESIYYVGTEDGWGLINYSGTAATVHCNYKPDLMTLHDHMAQSLDDLQSDIDDHSNRLASISEDLETAGDDINTLYGTTADLNESVVSLQNTMLTKVDGYIKSLYNGTSGNPKPVKFATVKYTNCTSENGVAAKFGMRSGHGNGVSYVFDQDITINVDFSGNVSALVFKNSGQAVTYSGVSKQYGAVFYITNTSAKTVDFYCLMGQYAYLKMNTPAPLTSSSNAASSTVLTQYSGTGTVYSSGTITGWATTKQVGVQFSFDTTSKTLTITT